MSIHLTKSGGSKRTFWLLLFQLLGLSLWAQVQISGRVTGPQNEGLPGITVQIQATRFSTSTEPDGTYSLSAPLKPGSYQIQFTGVGFKAQTKSIQVSGSAAQTVDAQLEEDALKMDEVVVTGTSAGTTRRQLGSYISTVKADELTKGATGDVLAALQGKTAGAQISQNSGDPAGGISVRLRGVSSINSSSEPLYIVDGVIVNNATNRVTNTQNSYDGSNFVGTIGQNRMVDINPADIERIEVLNGAAAAAIYGSRANAGVIQIFTKRGRSGAPVVNFSTSIMVNELRKKLAVNQAPVKFGGSPDVQTQDILTTTLTTTTPVTRYDYQDYIFHTGVGTDNNVSVSGGSEKSRYYVSGSYFYNQGIIRNTDFRRYNFRANFDQTFNRVFSMTMGLNYINSAANEKPNGNSFFSPMNSVTIIGNFHNIFERDANGNIKAVGERGRVNPVSVIEDFKQRQETNRVIASLGAKLRPFNGFTFDYTLGIDNYGQNGTTFMPPFAYNVNTAFFGGGPTLNPTLNGYASTGNDYFFQINNELNANYQFDITKDLGSTTQVGYSVQYEKNRYALLQGRGLSPFVETVNGASTILPSTDERTEISISGAYLQQNFKYMNKLFLTGAVRRDGSSVFSKDQRNQMYYKGSVSYLLSEEDFWKKSMPWWNTFKLRAAYGESGNLTGIGAYARFNLYSSNSYLDRSALQSSNQKTNENIGPERQRELEIGTDLSFLNNRVGVQFNWYNKRVENINISRQVAPTTGFTSVLDNFGELENRGIELVLNGSPVANKTVNWNLTAIFNRNRNKMVNIGQALTLLSTNGGAPVALLQGYPVGVFYGTFFAVDANGSQVKNSTGFPQIEKGKQVSATVYEVQRDGSGLPTGTTLRKVIGDPNPDWTGSLINEVGYKRFNLRVQLDAVQGVDVFNADFRTRQGVGNGKVAEQEHLGILPRGYVNSVYQIEEWRVDDGSFVKLREVSLSYSLGKMRFFNDLSIGLSGRNLVSWDNYKGYDPEVNAAGQSTLLRGIDFGAVPIPRTYRLSINARF
ncbi:SusC/RagA family TonB-linked outer membrane protein [Flavisolibacter nicotianae]|uniref:SusC/RagA family TonB-linked outer membrane protein n=1 Tax=Flavisolibacter nicotianae TaxID=2364882 RepID=UPI000EB36BE5|nr:SusC/RagA family TonB-linked outer membrane protein [Flavisolibacter nicotianae]